MHYHVLVFYPGDPSIIGLWQPHHSPEWTTHAIPKGHNSANTLFVALEELLDEQKIPLSTLTHIGAMTGPASYTQLRVFVATANALAWALHLPLFAIPVDAALPESLADALSRAQVNIPLEPQYPPLPG